MNLYDFGAILVLSGITVIIIQWKKYRQAKKTGDIEEARTIITGGIKLIKVGGIFTLISLVFFLVYYLLAKYLWA